MLPATLAADIRAQILHYLESTFEFRDVQTETALRRFVEDPENGLFKGPWAVLRRPFRPAAADAPVPFDIRPSFHPFRHQWLSWQRLTSKTHPPRSTLITTGTGSGKTECFLYPILDHCLRAAREGQRGIKAIILYPMNALATDQERRFAGIIDKTPELKATGVRVGCYTGRYDPAEAGASWDSGTKAMGPDHGITHHGTQQDEPPDILLTNYRMLDFLLMRPQDQRLWRFNEPGVLQYLVLDELHTYDGAQGADVACLIRRLKERMGVPKRRLCVVGTSATIESRADRSGASDAAEEGKDRLARFASRLFEEEIHADAVIDEDRLAVEEIVAAQVDDGSEPLPSPEQCVPDPGEDALAFVQRQAPLWGGPTFRPRAAGEPTLDEATHAGSDEAALTSWALDLGSWLKQNSLFKALLDCLAEAEARREDPLQWAELLERMRRKDERLWELSTEDRHLLLSAFFALIAEAREERSGKDWPLVPTQVQLWIRELRRLGRVVAEKPEFSWLDEPSSDRRILPVFHCSECGESGWIALHDPGSDAVIQSRAVEGIQLVSDPTQIYRGWFGSGNRRGRGVARSQHIVVISPWSDAALDTGVRQEAQLTTESGHWYLCPESLVLRREDGPCPLTGQPERFRVRVSREVDKRDDGRVVGRQGCPNCAGRDTVLFVGSQSATLSSLVIDEMFGSLLNSDPKLLAFTDSVQDASHRAGFFSARTYRFTFRTALQHVIDAAGESGLPLEDAAERLYEWWSKPGPGRPGSPKEAMAALMPPDLAEYREFLEYRNDRNQREPPLSLRRDLVTRLQWQVVSEFGMGERVGRTLEKAGSACLGWRQEVIDDTLARLRDRLEGISQSLVGVEAANFRLWLYGLLHHYRQRGALEHRYLEPLARRNFWGKYPFGRAQPGRETYPSGRQPRLMVARPTGKHEHEDVLAFSRRDRAPWHIVWARRALGRPGLDEQSILDLTQCLLQCGLGSGLFRLLHQAGETCYYTIRESAALLYPGGVPLACSETSRPLVKPALEAVLWSRAPTMQYHAREGRYTLKDFTARQRYYQQRFRQGALRRVVSREHTSLLETEEREQLERDFALREHLDDPNVLACTSTLEMGIDIGDLSSTILCSIPPNTASYLQRIGRAGRSTGTALLVAVVNQRPHDLFFYARPLEMLRGRVEPPGCWLDASAVLVRQYLAYCFDRAVYAGVLQELPRRAREMVTDLDNGDGHLPRMLAWVSLHEDTLRRDFLARFENDTFADTRARFTHETATDLLVQRIYQAAREFDSQRRELVNAQRRLQDQLKEVEEAEDNARREIEQEQRILRGRLASLDRTSSLEVLIDHGLLPNYAFPERGVRFHGAVYNRHRGDNQEHKPVEVIRGAGVALRELAPANHFYTHARKFDIQQITTGNAQQPLIEEWAICGACGHMRLVQELEKPGASPACPQCGQAHGSNSQTDVGQHRSFLEYARSQALSYVEHYESLSGDQDEERLREGYHVVTSFDDTVERAAGAVGDDLLPFGIEYRAAMVLREVNTGYSEQPGTIPFGPNAQSPEAGFAVCLDCGVVARRHQSHNDVEHRRSCHGRRRAERLAQQGRQGDTYRWKPIYLYRQLRSEAIRLLLPLTDADDLATLEACLYLGLRLRLEGDPDHLLVKPQIVPDPATGIKRHYLVVMDAVPGGTGYLKTLYQEKDAHDRDGEGVIDLLRRARDTLETCTCRRLKDTAQDTDGCYRCIRTFHQQYRAELISRERGIALLNQLIAAGERREPKVELAGIKVSSLYGSMLEKRFAETLQEFVENRGGTWEKTLIKGNRGFRFTIPGASRIWELELQPMLGPAQGVMVASQPDFLLRCDDPAVRPVAIFTDGFEFHCHPVNRIADDMRKRRAILESGAFHCWSITWHDLAPGADSAPQVCDPMFAQLLAQAAVISQNSGELIAPPASAIGNAMVQLKAYLMSPSAQAWCATAEMAAFLPLRMMHGRRHVGAGDLESGLDLWRSGGAMNAIQHTPGEQWLYNHRAAPGEDVVTCVTASHAETNRRSATWILARLGDSDTERIAAHYPERWRRFLACMNLYQFASRFSFWSTSEAVVGVAPELPGFDAGDSGPEPTLSPEWQAVEEYVSVTLRPCVRQLVSMGAPLPELEYYNDSILDDAFAEMAWPELEEPIAVLAGEQCSFAHRWKAGRWRVVTPDDLQTNGARWLGEVILAAAGGR